MQAYQARVENTLARWLPAPETSPADLHQAMRYAALGGGKRIRPLLVYATGAALGVPDERLDAPACAIELIHSFSLVHDDLPAMDDDDLRRGKPTCHRAFSEAIAILAGDALQTLAFEILAGCSDAAIPAVQRLEMLSTLAQATGSRGMTGGQAIDLAAVGRELTLEELEGMHRRKTGALISASVQLGALAHDALDPTLMEPLMGYAQCLGLAFQIQDDVLDVEADTMTLGKTQGADEAQNKPTYPRLLGLDEAKERATGLVEQAIAAIAGFDQRADALRALARYVTQRAF
ncbi:MAG: geranyl transferase [Gammaproteobacteria bacterium SG8_47]|nr:MAG: geranyl transferase [Gammaproteobacteria bacterium SG8_47]